MRALRLLLVSAPLLFSALACGEVGDVENRPPLATLDGQLTRSTTQALTSAANVRIAVVWRSVDGGYSSAQDISVTPVFPSKFHLELSDPPPATAMAHAAAGGGDGRETWPADVGVALGSVVAYEDVNGNGKLDLVDQSATAFVDRVLGVSAELSLVYFEGSTIPSSFKTDPAGNRAARGYNLLRFASCGILEKTCNRDADGWLPMTTLYEVPLTGEPAFGTLMCQGLNDGFGSSATSGSAGGVVSTAAHIGPGPDGVWPRTDDPHLSCIAEVGGRAYRYTKCETSSPGLCARAETQCTTTRWEFQTAEPPAGWPCPVRPL